MGISENAGGDGLHQGAAERCVFCSEERVEAAVAAGGSAFAVEDLYPVTEGHMLVIPLRHTPDFFSMTEEERTDALSLIDELVRDRKSTRLNSSHANISYAVFCLKKKKNYIYLISYSLHTFI